ncbi:MAG: RNA polymerase sigma factor RpoE [Gammaproteobacteria bacterium]|nr:MAG: RNA polymerase sigma factor RpoE [Gammaproteobacteria bacterium]
MVDQELVERVQQGDKRAFDVLVLKYQHRLIKLISGYIRDQSEVQDVAQEAFIKAYRALPKFRGDSAFYTWLYRIAINTAKNYLVSQGRKPRMLDIDDETMGGLPASCPELSDIATPERLLQRDEVEEAIFSAIDELPEDLRVAVTLRELEGLSYGEIAEVMECPIGTVRSRIFRARESINDRLGGLLRN